MSSKGELKKKKTPLKIFRAPSQRHKHARRDTFFNRFFRRKQRNVIENGEQNKDVAKSDEISEGFQEENEQEIYEDLRDISSAVVAAPTHIHDKRRCKSWKNKQKSDDVSSGDQSRISGDGLEGLRCTEFLNNDLYISPSSKKLAIDIFNQRPTAQFLEKNFTTHVLRGQNLGAYTESKSLAVCPAYSLDIKESNISSHKSRSNHKQEDLRKEGGQRKVENISDPENMNSSATTTTLAYKGGAMSNTDTSLHSGKVADDLVSGLKWMPSKENKSRTVGLNCKNAKKHPEKSKEMVLKESKDLALPFPIEMTVQTPLSVMIVAKEDKKCAGTPMESSGSSSNNDDTTNDMIPPSTESVSPKVRKGALKELNTPFVEEIPIVAYTRRTRRQPDSESSSSSSSSDSDDARRRAPVRRVAPSPRNLASISYSAKRRDITDEDRRRLHSYLNQFSSVHISRNLKDPIPKDPETLPGFHTNTSRRRMAEALSRHGASLFGRSRTPTPTPRRNNSRGQKRTSWFSKSSTFSATTSDNTMPNEKTDPANVPNQSQGSTRSDRSATIRRCKQKNFEASTEIRCHDLTKKPTSPCKNKPKKSDDKVENNSSGNVSRLVKEWNLEEKSFATMPSQDTSRINETPQPAIKYKKSYRSIHDNPTTGAAADPVRTAHENPRIHPTSDEIERKEKFLGSVDSDFDTHPFGTSNYVVHEALLGNTFCSEVDIAEINLKQDWKANKSDQKVNERLLVANPPNLLPKPLTKIVDKFVFQDRQAKENACNGPTTHKPKVTAQLPQSKKNRRAEIEPRGWSEACGGTTRKPSAASQRHMETKDLPHKKATQNESSHRLPKSELHFNSTLNWTIIMKHTPKKYESSTTDQHDFRDRR